MKRRKELVYLIFVIALLSPFASAFVNKNTKDRYDNYCENTKNFIKNELKIVQECFSDSDCIISSLNIPCSIERCQLSYNKNSDLNTLNKLSRYYKRKCREICPMYPCKNYEAKCINNQCSFEKTDSKKNCSEDSNWRCMPITQGLIFPFNFPFKRPKVCGCAPIKCNLGEFLIASSSNEKFPDGTIKGIFQCSRYIPA